MCETVNYEHTDSFRKSFASQNWKCVVITSDFERRKLIAKFRSSNDDLLIVKGGLDKDQYEIHSYHSNKLSVYNGGYVQK